MSPESQAPPAATTPIRDAATLVLLRDAAPGAGFEVLMVRRQRGAVFMADAYVFPGGRIEPQDCGDFAVAAAREAFEEAGVLLARDASGRLVDAGAPWFDEARAAVWQGEATFADVLAAHGLVVDTSTCVPFARWITPPTEARRFDARFFIARVPAGQDARPDAAGEVVEFRFATARALLDAQAAGEIKLPPPTLWHLTDLSRFATTDEALAWARARTIVPVRPKLYALDGVPTIVLPWDPAYAEVPVGEGEPLPPDSPVAGEVTRYELRDDRWVPRRTGRAG